MKEQKGICAVFLLVTIMTLSVLLLYMIPLLQTEVLTEYAHVNGVKADYLAEAGARLAIAKLKKGAYSKTGKESVQIEARDFPEGKFEVYLQGDDNKGILYSVGIVNNAKRQITVSFDRQEQLKILSWVR